MNIERQLKLIKNIIGYAIDHGGDGGVYCSDFEALKKAVDEWLIENNLYDVYEFVDREYDYFPYCDFVKKEQNCETNTQSTTEQNQLNRDKDNKYIIDCGIYKDDIQKCLDLTENHCFAFWQIADLIESAADLIDHTGGIDIIIRLIENEKRKRGID